MGETRGDHSIDIAINSGRDESFEPCIFRVPAILRGHNPKSFTPNSFSFGPLHHKKKHLKETEKIKKHYLVNLLSRKPTPHTTQVEFERSILEVEGRARKCYAFSTDHLNKDQFVGMLVLDGCFIIELLRNNEIDTKKNENKNNNNSSSSINNNNTLDEDDPVFSVSWVLQVLYHDLILLENQIPWFVLELLFEMTTSPTIFGSTKSLTDLALDFLKRTFSKSPLQKVEGTAHKSNHILDLLRSALVSPFGTRQKSTGDWTQIPTATSLKESGITFKTNKYSNLLDIKFSKHGVLEIPTLLIQETTCSMFRNLISYEQCYTNCEPKFTSYAILLNNLINTTEDIKVLLEAHIVDNWLNPNDTLEFLKNMYPDTYVREFYYVEIYQQMNKYRNLWWPRTRAAMVHMFWDPIGSLSLFAAAVALFNMTKSPTTSDGSTMSLTDLALGFFGTLFTVEALPKIESSLEINHILDLLRNTLVSSSGTGQESTKKDSHKSSHIPDFLKKALLSLFGTRSESTLDWQQIPTATSLKESGIKFKTNRSGKLLDIKFDNHGVLEIPTLLIQKTTCEAFRNLISYEQCYPNCEPKITSYAVLLNNLINTTKDIDVLREAGVVDNWLNPNDTLDFLENIYEDTYVKIFHCVKIYQQVNEYTSRFWPRARAAYVRMFWDPIGSLTLFAAAIALFLTFLQTLYTILQYIESSNSTSTPPPPPPS